MAGVGAMFMVEAGYLKTKMDNDKLNAYYNIEKSKGRR